MAMTISEKILARASGKKEVTPGEIVEGKVDAAMMHDLTGPLTLHSMEEMGVKKVWDPRRIVITFDHQAPASSLDAAMNHLMLRKFAAEHKIQNFYDIFEGICHEVLPEKGFALPGSLVVGADSHTTTYGALGCFATGVGSTDMAAVIASGKLWFRVPESMLFNVEGKLKPPVMSKDLILKVIGDVGMDGATYRAVEFTGSGVHDISVDGRLTMCNMGVEMGAKAAIVAADSATLEYLKGRTSEPLKPVTSDSGASYVESRDYDVSKLEPQVACPHSVDNVKAVREVEGKEVDQAFLGSCTNGRMEDFRAAAKILKGKKIPKSVRLIVAPASREVYTMALKEGLFEIFVAAGAIVESPSCAACMGAHVGVIGPGEVCISSSNRNFKGRQGSPESEVYLGSPATVAASALKGKITDPRGL
ncbi:MAG: 3-isopropylmalate dehydratase large subunit [Candidatus Hadarchaeota archaeon]